MLDLLIRKLLPYLVICGIIIHVLIVWPMYLPLPAVSIILSNAVRRCDMQSKEKLRDFFVGLGVGLLFFGSTIIFILNS